MAIPAPQRLFETHLTVADLDRSARFYEEVVGLEPAYRLEARRVAFYWIGGPGHTMLGLWEAGSAPNRMQLHVAFACGIDDVLAAPARLRALGAQPLDFDGQPASEAVVIAWMPAVSVFVRDPDDHLLELVAMLPGASRPELGVVPYSAWTKDA
ncbi:MAG: VOC family protein [Vicinamibacterales bacterium]